jgi:hypothetical protein
MTTAAKTGQQQGGRPFLKGQSGNPRGRPQGSRHKVSLLVDSMIEREAEALTTKALELAKDGHERLLVACLDRLAPVRRSRRIQLDLPSVETAENILKAQAVVVGAVARGEIDTDEAKAMADILETKRRALETVEFDKRITTLETSETRR